MANMSYCRFENTYRDLIDVEDHFDDENLSASEEAYRIRILQTCKRIVEDFKEELCQQEL